MKKLLHERLRDYDEDRYIYSCNTKDIASLIEVATDCRVQCSECRKRVYSALADEIERYYIPRPRFEDGEPVQGGDEFDKGYAHFAVIDLHHPSCYWLFEDYGGCLTETPIERPQPKVLDAGGVEIKVGDTVWDKHRGQWNVESIVDKDNVYVMDDYGVSNCFTSDFLTHKEPDSLEKLRDDMMTHHENWDYDPNEWLKMANRLTALIEKAD